MNESILEQTHREGYQQGKEDAEYNTRQLSHISWDDGFDAGVRWVTEEEHNKFIRGLIIASLFWIMVLAIAVTPL